MDLDILEKQPDVLVDVPVEFDNDGKPLSGFKVVGINSKDYQEADRLWNVQNLQRANRRGRPLDIATPEGAQEAYELRVKRDFAYCKACIKEMYGFNVGGVALELNDANLQRVFAVRPIYRSKCWEAIQREDVFTNP